MKGCGAYTLTHTGSLCLFGCFQGDCNHICFFFFLFLQSNKISPLCVCALHNGYNIKKWMRASLCVCVSVGWWESFSETEYNPGQSSRLNHSWKSDRKCRKQNVKCLLISVCCIRFHGSNACSPLPLSKPPPTSFCVSIVLLVHTSSGGICQVPVKPSFFSASMSLYATFDLCLCCEILDGCFAWNNLAFLLISSTFVVPVWIN